MTIFWYGCFSNTIWIIGYIVQILRIVQISLIFEYVTITNRGMQTKDSLLG